MKSESKSVKITLRQADTILNAINPVRQSANGLIKESTDLSTAKGGAGLLIHFLKKDIRSAFDAHFDALEEKRKKGAEIYKEDNESDDLVEIVNDINESFEAEEDVVLTKGKIPIEKIQDFASADQLEALDLFIEY